MKLQNTKILASILLVLISFVCVAQGGHNPPPPKPPPPPPGLPIDGGVLVVLALGLLYGYRKLMRKKTKYTSSKLLNYLVKSCNL